MKKGSPRDYDAETGCFEQLAQKSQLGEPHECYPLYRIGRTQENHHAEIGGHDTYPHRLFHLNPWQERSRTVCLLQ
jgi:hypothetical protein